MGLGIRIGKTIAAAVARIPPVLTAADGRTSHTVDQISADSGTGMPTKSPPSVLSRLKDASRVIAQAA